MMNRTLLVLACIVSSFQLLAQTSSQRAAVLLSATVQSNPPSITLNWTTVSNTSSLSIYRKLKSSTSWGSVIANPSSSSTSYQDYGVQVGTAYEYKVVRVSNGVTGTGYIASGIEVQPVDYRGKMILLVDNTLAPNMVNELNQLEYDLRADGWAVIRTDVSRTASASSIKSIIQGHYNSDPSNVKALYLVGHVPVPYSGNQAPDGHSEHVGAWPCDGYYGELTGSWTDNSVNNNGAQRSANRNIPGDGKFDQSSFPSDLELQVGRVDLYDMTAFSSSEGQLVRNYLNRAHSFKIKGWTPQNRALMFDNLQWVSNPLAGSGWRNMGPLVGASNITNANQNGTQFQSLVNGESYLWTYSSGGGSQLYESGQITFNGANNVGTTQNYAANSSMGGVFNMSCGSYFGDWDNKNNFLRAPIAKGDALTSVWSGIPAWYFHHMGQGENIGYSVLLTMNNSSLYTPITEGWQGSIGKAHLGLMGDPSIRMQMIAPPTDLSVSNNNGAAAFAWTASPESSLAGYHIYRFSSTGAITRLTSSPVSGTSYTNASIPFEAGKQYMVRAVKLVVNTSGSYYNLSLGSIATAAGTSTTVDCQGVTNGPAMPGTPCNDNDPCTTNDVWNSNCQCAGTPANVSASISAAGATTFCAGGSVQLNANTGSGYTHQWKKDGISISGATSTSYTATEAGVYTVRIYSGSCQATSSGITVTITTAPSASITAAGATTFCAGGSVQLNANTGSGFTYQWRKDGVSISGATSSSYNATEIGTYTVRVYSGSCYNTSSGVTVNTTTAPAASITAAGATTFCAGGSVQLNANTGSGFTYQWRKDGVSISGATSSSYTATEIGTYTVRVYSGSCYNTSSGITVNTTTAPSASITAAGATTFCAGGSVQLNANTGNGLTYQWRKDGVSISGATSSSYNATEIGTYTVRVYSGSCYNTSSGVTVNTTTAPAASISAAGSTTFCAGGSVQLNANTGNGFTYQWRKDGVSISGATSSSYNATETGTYTVRVYSGSCYNTSSGITVNSTTAPAASIIAGGATTFCSGGSVQLNANTGNGFTYQWRKDDVSINGATSNSYTATETGTYTVRVYSGSCYNTSSGVSVNLVNAPSASITAAGATTFCAGGSVQLNANTGSGLTYNWRKDGVAISGATSSSYTATSNGVYTVRVTSNGCQTTSSGVTVTVQSLPAATVIASGSTSFCNGGSVVLTAPAGSGLSYVWRRDGNIVANETDNTLNATISGSYTVQISNGNCTNTSVAQVVNVSSGPTATITPQGPTDLCEGQQVVLSATTGSGLAYAWTLNGSTITGATNATFTATQEGTYGVTISNGNCSAVSNTVSVNVASMPQPVITFEGAPGFCDGGAINLSTESDPHYTYQWTFNGITLTNANSNGLVADAAGSYAVAVQNGGCVAVSDVVDVEAFVAPEITCSADTTNGTVSVSVIGEGEFTYMWNNDPALNSAQVQADLTGNNTVVVTDQNGCSASCTVEIDMPIAESPCVGLRTHTQADWSAQPLLAQFDDAFPDDLTIGCGYRTMVLTSAQAVSEFLPSSGPSQRLPFGNMFDPGQGYGNALAGELVALKLAVRFDELYPEFSTSDVLLKDAVIASGTFAGMTVAQLIEEADKKIGGCFSVHNRTQLRNALAQINTGYSNGVIASGYLLCPEFEDPQLQMPAAPVPSALREPEDRTLSSTTAFPNPFINSTTIAVLVTENGKMTVDILSADGVEIEQLFSGDVAAGEEKKILWEATTRAKGVYMYRVIINERVMMGRLVLQ
jgi:hypothetical protein